MRLAAGWRAVTAYFDHPDPRLGVGAAVALAVVGNQPFYPLYVAYAAGSWVSVAFVTWLSTPAFALAPALARRSPDGGRALLLAAAFGNTVLSAVVLGPASGVEVFYLPSLLLAAILYPPGRRMRPLLVVVAATVAGLALERLGQPLAVLDPAQDHALAVMHAISAGSVAALMLFVAWRRGLSRSDAARIR